MMLSQLKDIFKSVIIAVITAFLIITFVFQTVSVDGLSMYPTLHNKDRLIVEKLTYYFRKPKQEDIVVIKYPADTREKFIKRVLAVGGDKVKIAEGRVYVNGKIVSEPYTNEPSNQDFDEVLVPQNTVFVLGDNRNHSRDSRFPDVGFVNTKLVVGKACVRIYPFSRLGSVK